MILGAKKNVIGSGWEKKHKDQGNENMGWPAVEEAGQSGVYNKTMLKFCCRTKLWAKQLSNCNLQWICWRDTGVKQALSTFQFQQIITALLRGKTCSISSQHSRIILMGKCSKFLAPVMDVQVLLLPRTASLWNLKPHMNIWIDIFVFMFMYMWEALSEQLDQLLCSAFGGENNPHIFATATSQHILISVKVNHSLALT